MEKHNGFRLTHSSVKQFVASIFFSLLIALVGEPAQAQVPDSLPAASLQEVIVKAFELQARLRNVAAAVNVIGPGTLQRFGPVSPLQAINSTPGAAMEERSPGSYRINIRGSSIRSPFGVRNIKVYLNGSPYSDPGGNTYLNALGYYNFAGIEIIKGPASSLYGAGTGGVLLISTLDAQDTATLSGAFTTGGYNLRNSKVSVSTGGQGNLNRISFQQLSSSGYRTQSAVKRTVVSWDGRYATGASGVLQTLVFYSDLFYQTPGALTLKEFQQDPRQARPAGGGYPSAVQNKAAIYQRTFYASVQYQQAITEAISNTTSAYAIYTDFKNPAIRNYGKSTEPHTGARTVFRYRRGEDQQGFAFLAGAEGQQNFTTASNYTNKAGNADVLQTLDEVHTGQASLFTQATYAWNGFEVTGGASVNWLKLSFQRTVPAGQTALEKKYSGTLAPRISIERKGKLATLYSSLSRGFSPPASTELVPTGSAVNLDLNPEKGTNIDLGMRGRVGRFLFYDVNVFHFGLENTIVQRRDAGGGDYYANAGKTAQSGIESSLTLNGIGSAGWQRQLSIYISHTYHDFRYKSFMQLTADYSNNRLPGNPLNTVAAGITSPSFLNTVLNVNYYYSDKVYLSDANGEAAPAYGAVNAKLGWMDKSRHALRFAFSAGVDNLFNRKYSLGYDINAAGGRFYNAAPLRTGYVTVAASYHKRK